jgi:hypothetical protein
MGKVENLSTRIADATLRSLMPLLDPGERDAVLGDLLEEQQRGWAAVAAVAGLAGRRIALRLRRGQAWIPVSAGAAAADPAGIETWPEWVLPLAVGLIAATCVVALLVPPRAHALSWSGLMSRSAFLLGMAALAALGAVALLHRAYREYFRRPGATLLACAWSAAIWIPLLLLVWSEHAIWAVLAPVPIAAVVASFAKRKQEAAREWTDEVPAGREPMFATGAQVNGLRLARLAVVTAFLLEALIFAALCRAVPLMCSLVIVTTACLAWGFTPVRTGAHDSAAPVRSQIAVLPCFLLTCMALTPFLRMGLGMGRLSSVVLANPLQGAPQLKAVNTKVYSGVVLMAPPLPKRKLLLSPPRSVLGGVMRPAHPLVIPFDGAYWYFQAPATGPTHGAKVQRGDPTKAHIHSSDWTPLEMEAHQSLGNLLDASCCRNLSVALVNADTRRGLIQVEARLRDVTGREARTVSLGTVPIQSSAAKSISTARPDVAETLRFPIAGEAASARFNEITLVFKLAPGRELAGARVQVSSFTLQP